MENDEIISQAIKFAKSEKEKIARELTDIDKYKPDKNPVSVFMAGSPGAGKTEFSKRLIQIFEKDRERQVVRIDADDIRPLMPGYTGNNSFLFQGAVSLVVEKIHDNVLHQNQSFIFDQTFSKYEKAKSNIKRSLDKKRPVLIFYVYQEPKVAWDFTQARELLEGRNIPKKAFIEQFLGAKNTVSKILRDYGGLAPVFIVKKNFETNVVDDVVEVDYSKHSIDYYFTDSYTEDDLNKIL